MTELQLEFIREFGRKELSFGCIVSQWWDEYQIFNFSDRFKNARYWDNEEEEAMMIMNWGYKILWHPVHWEDVFARLKEILWADDIVSLQFWRLQIFSRKLWTIEIECNAIVSPMEQPELIEQLLLLIK